MAFSCSSSYPVSSWFFENISRQESENLLLGDEGQSIGTFLIRPHQHRPGWYALSVKDWGDYSRYHQEYHVKHYEIKLLDSGEYYISTKRIFDNLEELVMAYSKNAYGLCHDLSKPYTFKTPEPIMWDHATTYRDKWKIPRDESQLIQNPFFHNVSRKEAEELLLGDKYYPSGTFLIRPSQQLPNWYSLSLIDWEGLWGRYTVKHYKIRRSCNGRYYMSPNKTFHSLPKLVKYYSKKHRGLCHVLGKPYKKPAPTILDPASAYSEDEIPRDKIQLKRKKLKTQYKAAAKTCRKCAMSTRVIIKEFAHKRSPVTEGADPKSVCRSMKSIKRCGSVGMKTSKNDPPVTFGRRILKVCLCVKGKPTREDRNMVIQPSEPNIYGEHRLK